MDTTKSPPAEEAGYSAADAARVFDEFLEYQRGHDSFWAWLMGYPSHGPGEPPDPDVENEIDHAILALLAFQHGTRTWEDVRQELHEARVRLTGLARYPAPAR